MQNMVELNGIPKGRWVFKLNQDMEYKVAVCNAGPHRHARDAVFILFDYLGKILV